MSATTDNTGYKKVFVSLDGSPAQDKVFSRALAQASLHGAELYIGHVIDSTALETKGVYPVELIPNLRKSFLQSIDPLVKEAEADPNIPHVQVAVQPGRIRETLMEEMIATFEPDLIVCGARGLSAIKYALLGSVSTFLLRNATCDVLVIK